MQSFDVFPKKAIFLFLNGLLKKNAATTAAAAAYNSLAKSFVLSILSIDVKPLFSPLTALKMALLDMMKGLFSASHMEVELATHLKFGQMLYEQHATIIFKKNILWDWSSNSF